MITFDIDAMIQVAQQRMKFWDITEEQINELEAEGKPKMTFTLRSPYGICNSKPAVRGSASMRGELLTW
jgi:hypothetical protein